MDRSIDVSQVCENLTYIEEFDALCIESSPSRKKSKYPAKQHARSVARHLGVKDGLIYLPGRPTVMMEDSDQQEPFRQRRYFYYLSGVDFEDCIVTYDIRKDILRLFIPPVNRKSVVWIGAKPGIEECKERYDVDHVDLVPDIDDYIVDWLRHQPSSSIYALHKDQVPRRLLFCHADRVLVSIRKYLNTTLLQPAMDAARVIKSDYEIDLIRKANEISAHAHEGVLAALSWSDNESQLEAVFAGRCIAKQAKKQAYDIIVGSGENASTLHYSANDEPLKGRQLVCLDGGCEWNCYASDITRTFPISGTYTKEAAEIYEIVKEMQETCIDAVAPGVAFSTLYRTALDIAVKGLMKLDILHNGSFDDVYLAGLAFFPHGLGHHVGLEVHDVSGAQTRLADNETIRDIRSRNPVHPRPQALDSAPTLLCPYERHDGSQRLAPNMVITIEPGIYFSRFAFEEVYLKDPRYGKYVNKDLLETYYPVGGVRIEDDILVTKEGYENLTTAPKGEEACRIIREHKEKSAARKDSSVWRLWT
ncbi:MAG: hypothetical protein M1818_007204 [Claussenomyces sp. TS43310]|nr:MAG: hypothetical protein M1818_007204 [Claussenomyces sp. TS43310]